MRLDYMKTYENYYSVSANKTPEKYESIAELYFDPFAAYLHGTEDINKLKAADYVQNAVDYLVSGGMTEEEVLLLGTIIIK